MHKRRHFHSELQDLKEAMTNKWNVIDDTV